MRVGMAGPKKIEDGVRVSVVISKKQHQWLKHMAIETSRQEGREIRVSELIRGLIEEVYLPPKDEQLALF